jgi:hypothetical protein
VIKRKDEGMKSYCNYCDPKFFVIYGFCGNCQRRCYPPLFDPKGKQSLEEYDKMRSEWNSQRSDLILDEIRRKEE